MIAPIVEAVQAGLFRDGTVATTYLPNKAKTLYRAGTETIRSPGQLQDVTP